MTVHLLKPKSDPADAHALVRRAIAGEEEAVTQLIQRLMPVVRARVRRWLAKSGRVVGPLDGEDLVQEVWLRLIDDRGRRLLAYDPARGTTLEGFTGIIAEREIGKLRRSAGAQKRTAALVAVTSDHAEVPADHPSPEAEVEARDLAARLGDHLGRELPARGQLILRYAFVDELPPARVAQILGVTVQVVYNWQHKIRTAARAFLASA